MVTSTLISSLNRFVTRLESVSITLCGTLAAIAGVLLIRFLFEGLSSRSATGFLASDISTIVHYFLFYATVFLGTTIILSLFAKIPIVTATKVALFGSLAVWIAPAIDLIFFGGYSMGYIFVGPNELLSYFITYFGPLGSVGITPGIRVELALVFIGSALYTYLKTCSIARAILAAMCLYVFVFVTVAIPSIVLALPVLFGITVPTLDTLLSTSLLSTILLHPGELLQAITLQERLFNAFISQVFLIISTVLVFVWFFLWNPQGVRAFIGNMRLPRLVGYIVLVTFGAIVAQTSVVAWAPNLVDLYTFTTAVIAIVAAWIFAVATNDLVDEETDAISNSSRPLIQGTLSKGDMHNIAVVSGLWILLSGISLGSYSLFFLMTYTAAYFVYSVPPLRLKQVPGLSSLLVSFACLSAVLFGYYLISENRVITDFPLNLVLLIIVFFTIAINFKDLKDIEGDKAAGVTTFATLLGQRNARFVFGGVLTGALALVALFLPLPFGNPILAWGSVVASVVVWIGMVLGRGERFLFIVFLLYSALVGVFLLS